MNFGFSAGHKLLGEQARQFLEAKFAASEVCSPGVMALTYASWT